jgi:hypothetical protein
MILVRSTMPERVCLANYGFPAATAVWTLGWLAAAALAADRVSRSHDAASIAALTLSAMLGAAGLWLTVRMAAHTRLTERARNSERNFGSIAR